MSGYIFEILQLADDEVRLETLVSAVFNPSRFNQQA